MRVTLALLVISILPVMAGKRPDLRTHTIVPEKELFITDLAVVESQEAQYPGPFSFGHLMRELSGDRGVKALLLDWVKLWEEDQVVNGFTVEARPKIREKLIDPWKANDHQAGVSDDDWQVDLAHAPFRLLAIVNRLDIGAGVFFDERQDVSINPSSLYYGNGGAEVRFIFAALDGRGEPLEGGFTIILEYGVDFPRPEAKGEIADELSQYAAYWHRLGSHSKFDEAYLRDLVSVTSVFTDRRSTRTLTGLRDSRGRAIEVKLPDRQFPHLSQIRTNDGALADEHEFRQCVVSSQGEMKAAPISATPAAHFRDRSHREHRYLARHFRDNRSSIEDGTHIFRSHIQGRSERDQIPLLAGSEIIPNNDSSYHWPAIGVRDREVRRLISRGTCAGCHSGETGTQFFHVAPRARGNETMLSAFLKPGRLIIPDPAHPRKSIELNEMTEREVVFAAALDPNMRPNSIKLLLQRRMRDH